MAETHDHRFRTSTFCGSGGCVEVAPLDNGMVAVRDSKDTRIPEQLYTHQEWVDFIRGVKAGEFDFDPPPRSRSPHDV